MTEVAKKAPQAIIRGRIALAIVYLIRFVETAEAGTKALAEKYGTTVGKIDDIRKNRNFAYVTEDVKFTQTQIDEGITFIAAHEDAEQAELVTDMLNKLEIATPEEAEAFANVKRKAGGQPRTNDQGEVIASGGGNRTTPAKAKKEKAEVKVDDEADIDALNGDEPSADDLLGI